MQLKLKSHKPGDDITIMNTFVKKYYNAENRYEECLTIVYKDNRTGIKYKEEIVNPTYEFYTIKPERRVSYNRTFVPIDWCEVHHTPRISLDRAVCDALGRKDWYKECIRNGDRQSIKKIHKDPDVFMSDNNIEDHYRFWFAQTYKNDICAITKSFFDIEVDGIDIAGQFPEPGECPVNAITIVFQDRMETYTFLLDNPRNPLIGEFKKELAAKGTNELKQFVLDHVSEFNKNPDGSPFYFGLDQMKFNILFYDEDKEIDLIKDFFKTINTFKPDFCLAWNQAFDIP